MASSPDPPRRPARLSRWAASGLTAAATVGAVGAMAGAAPDDTGDPDVAGAAVGAVARYEAEVAAAALMAAADPGIEAATPVPPPTIARAGVS